MRVRPIGTMPFSIVGIVCVNVFVFLLCLLLFVARIFIPLRIAALQAMPRPITPIAIESRLPRTFALPPSIGKSEPCTPEGFEIHEELTKRELSRYPIPFLNSIGLRRVVLCSRLEIDGRERGGAALPSLETILLNTRDFGDVSYDGFRGAIHHETFHFIDVILAPPMGGEGPWSKLSPEGLRYGGEEVLRALEITGLNPGQRAEIPGFVDHYAMVDAREDRAELYAYMVFFPDDLEAMASEDGIIAEKVRCLRRELHSLAEIPSLAAVGPWQSGAR